MVLIELDLSSFNVSNLDEILKCVKRWAETP